MFKYDMGVHLKDVITGFKGVVTARIEYINKCVQYQLQPTSVRNGIYPASKWIDEEQVAPTAGKRIVLIHGNLLGGDRDLPPAREPDIFDKE
jgi:hypothetical protein